MVVIAVGMLAAGNLAHAAEWFVRTDGSDAADGMSWPTAFQTVGKAVTASAAGDTVTVSNGLYTIGAAIAVDKANLTIQGAGTMDDTILDRNGGDRVFNVTAGGFRLENLTLKRATGSEAVRLATSAGGARFVNCRFDANKHGVYIATASTDVRYEGCEFLNHTTGGIYYNVAIADSSHAASNCVFRGNATGVRSNTSNNTLFFNAVQCVFERNPQAGYVNNGNLLLDRCVLVGNAIGIYLQHSDKLYITNSIVAYNPGQLTSGQSSGSSYVSASVLHANELGFAVGASTLAPGVTNAPPSFVDPLNGDYRLYADSPACNLAGDGTHAGLHPAVSVPVPAGTTYYVRTDGSDTASGLNDTTDPATGAFKTLQRAADAIGGPGDTVRVAGGAYIGAAVLSGTGSATKPIRFSATAPATLDADVVGLMLSNAVHVVVEGFEVFDATTHGVTTEWALSCALSNVVSHANLNEGVRLFNAPDFWLADCQVFSNKTYGIRLDSSSNVRITDCRSWRNTSAGVYAARNLAGGGQDSHALQLVRTAIYENGSTGLLMDSSSAQKNWDLDGCVIFNNSGSGIATGENAVLAAVNTIIARNRGYIIVGGGSGTAKFAFDYCDFFGNRYLFGSGQYTMGEHNLYLEPSWAKPYEGDFRLYDISPCVDSALAGMDMGLYPDGAAVAMPAASDWYVAPAPLGSDSNDGNSPTAPFETLQRAFDAAGPGGDSITVAAGDYAGGAVLTTGGFAESPLTVVAPSGAQVVGGAVGLTVQQAGAVVLSGFTATNTTSAGFRLEDVSLVTLTNCHALAGSADGLVAVRAAGLEAYDSTYIGNGRYGVSLTAAVDARFERFRIANSGSSAVLMPSDGGSQRVTFLDGVIDGNSPGGTVLSYGNGGCADSRFDHCSLVANPGTVFNYDHNNLPFVITNSILAYNARRLTQGKSGARVAQCLVWGNGDGFYNVTEGGDMVYAAPGFARFAGRDFRLFADSPAIGAATDGGALGARHLGTLALAGSATWYVAPDGSDANNGLSPGTAFATLDRASAVATPGTTVHVQPGLYETNWIWSAEGSPTQPVNVIAAPGAVIGSPDGVGLTVNAAHVHVTGLQVTNAASHGFALVQAPDSRLIRCVAAGNGQSGFYLDWASASVLEACRGAASAQHGAHAYYSGQTLVDRSLLHGNTLDGILIDYSGRSTVRQSLVYGNSRYGVYQNSVSPEIAVQSSVIHGNASHGFSGSSTSGNTSYIQNNIVMGNNYGLHDNSSMVIYELNCDVFGNTQNYVGFTASPTSISADPLFRGAATGNFHLLAGSPCIDAGTNQIWMAKGELTAFDPDGNPRIANGVVDIGAYEVYTAPSTIIVR